MFIEDMLINKFGLGNCDIIKYNAMISKLVRKHRDNEIIDLYDEIGALFEKKDKTNIEKAVIDYIDHDPVLKKYKPSKRSEYSIILSALVEACDRLGESGWFSPEGVEMTASDWFNKLVTEAREKDV